VEENRTWRRRRRRRRRYNYELYKLFNEPDIAGYIKVKRLQWAGHLIRTSEKPSRKYLTPNQKEQGKWEDQN
jgi:hypothetical protein